MKKGIILAGGKGSRLYPLTYGTTKALLPVYDKPLIYYSIKTLTDFGIDQILIISSSSQNLISLQACVQPIKDISFQFRLQNHPNGIPEAFVIGDTFIQGDDITLILGDNIFDGTFSEPIFANTIYGIPTKTPENYGVIDFDSDYKVKRIVEKPKIAPSEYAVPGLYHFDNSVVKKASSLERSKRGEFEISDLINLYIQENNMNVKLLPSDLAWFDCGTHDHLLEAGNYVKAIQNRTSKIIGYHETRE